MKKTINELKKKFASDKVVTARRKTCSECPRLFKPTFTCKECGCFMKIKSRLKLAKCPLGKWDE